MNIMKDTSVSFDVVRNFTYAAILWEKELLSFNSLLKSSMKFFLLDSKIPYIFSKEMNKSD